MAFWVKLSIPYHLEPQYQIGPYYADFAHLESNTVIEIDGAAYHSSPEQIERDRCRTGYLEGQGYRVVRFPASQVHRDPVRSVYRAKRPIEQTLAAHKA